MKLFGSVTSPYVRRVRILALELGVPFDLVDSATDEGQKKLRDHSPIWKVPAAILDGDFIVDSHVIIDELLKRRNKILPLVSELDLTEKNRLNYTDTTLDSLIQRFYLEKDGASPDLAYMKKQLGRAESAFSAIEATVDGLEPTFSHFSLAITTAIDWILLRKAYPIERHEKLVAFAMKVNERESFSTTRPV